MSGLTPRQIADAAIANKHCARPPVGCGREVTPEVNEVVWQHNSWFRNQKSLQEYLQSGLCQRCQDEIFGRD